MRVLHKPRKFAVRAIDNWPHHRGRHQSSTVGLQVRGYWQWAIKLAQSWSDHSIWPPLQNYNIIVGSDDACSCCAHTHNGQFFHSSTSLKVQLWSHVFLPKGLVFGNIGKSPNPRHFWMIEKTVWDTSSWHALNMMCWCLTPSAKRRSVKGFMT